MMRIAVLYEPTDNVTPPRRKREKPRDAAKPARARKRPKLDRDHVAEALREGGHETFFHELSSEKALLGLAGLEADLVFNLAEAYAGDDFKEAHVAAFLDLLGLPYTGSGPQGLFLAQDKTVAKKLFTFHGIRTPRFATSHRGTVEHIDDLQFPLIVKPASEDGSVGIDAGSVVADAAELRDRVRVVRDKFACPALVEEYIEGREIYVAVLGNEAAEALPPVEIDLTKLPEGMPRIAGREVKWEKGTEAYDVTNAVVSDVHGELRERLLRTALLVYRVLDLRDYGRVDLRVTPKGEVYVIEANPNPWLAPEAELPIAAAEAGRTYSQLIAEIVRLSLARYE
jgi:D-alanine-D-alanine ligase